jgi:2-amino-4-hydroxy-6-hydroxymethyldihydropteridine diphosphokinase
MSNQAAVGIGSNINPKENIEKVINILANEHTLLKKSTFIKTIPIGYTNQPDFLNGSILIETTFTFEQFTFYLKNVEKRLGRVKIANKYGPRIIDLDIIVWNNKIVDKDFYERDFLKQSVLELLPSLIYTSDG